MKTTLLIAIAIIAVFWIAPILFKLFIGLFVVGVALAVYNGHGADLVDFLGSMSTRAWAWVKSLTGQT